MFFGFALADVFIVLVFLLVIVSIVYAVLRQYKREFPELLVQIFWILVVAVVVIGIIRSVAKAF